MSTQRFSGIRAGLAGALVWTLLAVSPVQTVEPFSAWSEPENLGEAVNTSYEEFLPELSRNELSLFFSSTRPGPFAGEDIWVSRRASRGAGDVDIYRSELTFSGAFGPAVGVAELNTPQNGFRPTIRADGLEVILDSNRAGSVARDLWASTRTTPSDSWSLPVNLGSVVNGPYNDSLAAMSPDGRTLVFTSDRADGVGFGGSDLYISSRSRK